MTNGKISNPVFLIIGYLQWKNVQDFSEFPVEVLASRLAVSHQANTMSCLKVKRPKFLFRKQSWRLSGGASSSSSSSSVVVLLGSLPVEELLSLFFFFPGVLFPTS